MLALAAVTGTSASAQKTVGTPGSGQGITYPFGQGAGFTKFQEFLSASYFTAPLNINAVTYYRTANTTGTFQQGTFSLYLNATTTAPTLTFTGNGIFNYNTASGNLLIDVDFTPIGSLFAFGRASFDSFSDPIGNQSDLVAFASDQPNPNLA